MEYKLGVRSPNMSFDIPDKTRVLNCVTVNLVLSCKLSILRRYRSS